MALDLYMVKHLGALRPMGPLDAERLDELKNGAEVRVTIARPRNVQHHRLFFAALNLVFQNQERYDTLDNLLAAVKVALGHCDWLTLKDGTQVAIPKSIAFSKMDQASFEQFWSRFCDLVEQKIIPGLKRADMERELREMIGAMA